MPAQDRPHRARRNLDAEPDQLALDAPVPPNRILARQPQHKFADVSVRSRATDAAARIRPAARDQLAVPAQKRRRRDKQGRPRWPRQRPAQRRQQHTVGRPQLRPSHLALQDLQLVAQHKNLELLRPLGAQAKHDQLEQTPAHPVHQRDQQADGALPVDHATLRRHGMQWRIMHPDSEGTATACLSNYADVPDHTGSNFRHAQAELVHPTSFLTGSLPPVAEVRALIGISSWWGFVALDSKPKEVFVMRRTVVFAAALTTTLVVIAAATAAPPAVTISLSRPNVVYGGSVTLSGKVSDNKAGQSVQVMAEPYPATSFSALGSPATTTAGGHWTDVVKPTIETSYQASWKNTTSSTVTVKVRPLITLVKLSTGSFSTKVTGARSFAGRFVLVQRLSSTGTATLKKVTLDASSSATFRVRLHHGRNRLRVVMPTSQTAPGYITGMSKVLTVSR
jgi:hypothetical protein